MRGLGSRVCTFLLALGAAAAAAAEPKAAPVEVRAPDAAHVAWASTAYLAESARPRGIELLPILPSASESSGGKLVVMAIHEFARLVPAVSVLELPFFYRDLPALHRAVDGRLGTQLRTSARESGWELLTIWDEGMELMSGNIPYLQPQVLSGKEFVILREDPIAEKNFLALDIWTRRVSPASLAQLQTECVVSGRSVTAQQIEREQLARVHLDVTLSRHRYVGWVVAMRIDSWRRVDSGQRSALIDALREMSEWQRDRARQEEERALTALRRDGMTIYPLPPESWQRYRQMQPAWESFLPEVLPHKERRLLVELATSSSASVARSSDSSSANPAPPRMH
jgi:TRAP-type C4-dicarboxylate transport system substrate-binding protein